MTANPLREDRVINFVNPCSSQACTNPFYPYTMIQAGLVVVGHLYPYIFFIPLSLFFFFSFFSSQLLLFYLYHLVLCHSRNRRKNTFKLYISSWPLSPPTPGKSRKLRLQRLFCTPCLIPPPSSSSFPSSLHLHLSSFCILYFFSSRVPHFSLFSFVSD